MSVRQPLPQLLSLQEVMPSLLGRLRSQGLLCAGKTIWLVAGERPDGNYLVMRACSP
jgi:hypothetical protein